MKLPLPLLLLLATGSVASAQSSSTLASNSPFLPPNTTSAPAAEATPLELRGILTMGGKTSFNIYDPATKASSWVGLNEPGHPYTVTDFDVGTERVTVDYQGRAVALVLQRPKIVSAPVAVTAAPGVPGAVATQPTPMPAPVLNPTPADEARRLEAVAAEVRRRRALRQQAAQMQAQQQNGQAPQPPPANGQPPQPPQPVQQ